MEEKPKWIAEQPNVFCRQNAFNNHVGDNLRVMEKGKYSYTCKKCHQKISLTSENFSDYLNAGLSKEEIEEMKELEEFIYKKCEERDKIHEKRKNHYHYLVSYYVSTKKPNEFYFGDTTIDWADKIKSNHIKRLKEYMLEEFEKNGISIRDITIISISPLECGCD